MARMFFSDGQNYDIIRKKSCIGGHKVDKNHAFFNENITKNDEINVKKRFLMAYRENALEIELLERELEKWQRRAVFDKDATKIVDMLKARKTRAAGRRDAIERAIAALEDAKLRTIMTLRYLRSMKWEEIEEALHLEYRWLLRLHRKALQQIGAE